MTPEYLSAIASVATFIVIAVTAAAAIGQLRHIRASNQLTGLLHFTQWFESESMQRANRFVEQSLPDKIHDESYLAGLLAINPDRHEHPELMVCDFMEQTGSYLKFGMLDKEQYIDLTGEYVRTMWQQLHQVVAIRRLARNNGSIYENFEFVAALAQANRARTKTRGNYPRKLARLMPEEEWRSIGAQFGLGATAVDPASHRRVASSTSEQA